MTQVQRISLTVNEAAEATGLTRHVVEAMIRSGLLSSIKTGSAGKRKIIMVDDLTDVLTFVKENNLILNEDLMNLVSIKNTYDYCHSKFKKERRLKF